MKGNKIESLDIVAEPLDFFWDNFIDFVNKIDLPILLAKFSFVFLFLSMLFYWFQATFKYNRNTFIGKIPSVTMWLANCTLAAMLSIRWIESGHFPLSNLYESLLFLSWSLTSIHFILEHAFDDPFNTPSNLKHLAYNKHSNETRRSIKKVPSTIFSLTRLALPNRFKVTSRLGVQTGVISTNSDTSDLFVYNKDNQWSPSSIASPKENKEPVKEVSLTLGAITSPLALFTNAFATFSLPQSMQRVTVLVPALQSNWLMMHVSVMMVSYAALLSGSLLAIAFLVVRFNKEKSCLDQETNLNGETWNEIVKSSEQNLDKEITSKGLNHWSQKEAIKNPNHSQIASMAKHNLVNDLTSKRVTSTPTSYTSLFIDRLNVMQLRKTPTIDLEEILDNLSYRSIGLGFALLTIGIFSGAVWANEAWGSYWNWDPKETWAFITWLVFAFYLHTRLSKGWVGKESASVATFGFLVIWFCYLGVNLFGKGLHSYGWFPGS